MANYVKLKSGISIFSISILILIPLLESNFNTPLTIKRWSALTWNDFQGFVQPFSKWGAIIGSNVYLEYDSSAGRYHAYAGQNNVRSWVKESTRESDYALTHEQYHFNITELHARALNEYIAENPGGSERLFLLRLGSLRIDLRRMQSRYDNETAHSLIYDKQRRWEFKIDSLLTLQHGWIHDTVSGAQIFFPSLPDSLGGVNDDSVPYRSRTLAKYAMQFGMISYHIPDVSTNSIRENLYTFDPTYGRSVKFVEVDTTRFDFQGFVISTDTSGYTYYTKWIYNDPYLYKIYSNYPNRTIDSTGYYQNAKAFLDSFRLDSIR